MIRSDTSLVWRCCGTDWPAHYRHCAWCGTGVLTVDRIVCRFPMVGGGDMAVVATREVDAASWRFLGKMVEASAPAFAERAAKKPSASSASDPDAASVVLAVDPSRSTPDVAPTKSVEAPLDAR